MNAAWKVNRTLAFDGTGSATGCPTHVEAIVNVTYLLSESGTMMGLGPSGQPWDENQRCTAYNISFWKMPSSVLSSGNWDVDNASGGG